VRQVLGAVAEFEKTSLVAKLKAARERKKADTGKCGGRKTHAEHAPEVVALAKQLRAARPEPALREIAAELARRGHLNRRRNEYSSSAIASMVGEIAWRKPPDLSTFKKGGW
jgi:DNA invertase Pin-like site-specific DNA recombinase